MSSSSKNTSAAGVTAEELLPDTVQAVVDKVCFPPPEMIDLEFIQINGDRTEMGLGPRIVDPFVLESMSRGFPRVRDDYSKERFTFELNPGRNPFLRPRGQLPTEVPDTTRQWFDRIMAQKSRDLMDKGVYHLLQFMVFPVDIDANFMAALTSFWSTSCNAFHFKFGMLTPTILDMAILFGLKPFGKIVGLDIKRYAEGNDADYKDMKSNFDFVKRGSYSDWVRLHMNLEEDVVNLKEYVAFFMYWLSKYVVCSAQYKVEAGLLPLAYYLAMPTNANVALGPFVMSNLYNGLNRLIVSEFSSWGGPLWMLQVWGFAYFPSIRPELAQLPRSDVSVHGLSFLCGRSSFQSLSAYIKALYNLDMPAADQCPLLSLMAERPLGPAWLVEAMGNYKVGMVSRFWRSCLSARDLCHRVSLGNVGNPGAGVEIYNPHYVSLQFGLKQLLPFPIPWTWNDGCFHRNPFTHMDHFWHVSYLTNYILRTFYRFGDVEYPRTLSEPSL